MKMRRALKSFKQLKGRSQVFQMYLIAVRIQISFLIADRKQRILKTALLKHHKIMVIKKAQKTQSSNQIITGFNNQLNKQTMMIKMIYKTVSIEIIILYLTIKTLIRMNKMMILEIGQIVINIISHRNKQRWFRITINKAIIFLNQMIKMIQIIRAIKMKIYKLKSYKLMRSHRNQKLN